ncbi:MAG: type VII toxin-antitoxin system HepT family RNase toxin [Bacillota bacterium]
MILLNTLQKCTLISPFTCIIFIVAKSRLGMLKNYNNAFEILGKNNIIPKDFLPVLKNMVSFRNLAVHMYDQMDEDEVYNIISARLPDFERFISQAGIQNSESSIKQSPCSL